MTHVHLIGIGGTGLSAIALVLLGNGYTVSGSDLHVSALAKAVIAAGARFSLGHHPDNVAGADIVVRSSAIADHNVEVQAAMDLGIPVLKRSEFLSQLTSGKDTIAVAGTHGKTSTTAMISWGLTQLNWDPSFILGGVVARLGTNAKAGNGDLFVIEADEYDRMFLGLNPEIEVITNIEHDHPDCYPTLNDFMEAFKEFVGRLNSSGILIACGDDPGSAEVIAYAGRKGIRTLTYGLKSAENAYQASNLRAIPKRGGYEFHLIQSGVEVPVSLQVPGVHNVLNALAAFAVFDQLGIKPSDSARVLGTYEGTGRRFEVIGEKGGVIVISDYAHHPTEIQATLAAARSKYPDRRIWAIWQPHTYSRTKLLFSEFVNSFKDADQILVTEVFPAREPIEPEFSGSQIVAAMNNPNAGFAPRLEAIAKDLAVKLVSGDVLVVLSAGDADQICSQVLDLIGADSLEAK